MNLFFFLTAISRKQIHLHVLRVLEFHLKIRCPDFFSEKQGKIQLFNVVATCNLLNQVLQVRLMAKSSSRIFLCVCLSLSKDIYIFKDYGGKKKKEKSVIETHKL